MLSPIPAERLAENEDSMMRRYNLSCAHFKSYPVHYLVSPERVMLGTIWYTVHLPGQIKLIKRLIRVWLKWFNIEPD